MSLCGGSGRYIWRTADTGKEVRSLLLEAVTALSQQAAIFKRESFFLGTIES
jgi:hypothetical protein